MKKIAVVTDSNSGITQKEAEQMGIFVLPMPFLLMMSYTWRASRSHRKSFTRV